MTNELKPCPFCGGSAHINYDPGNEVYNQSWVAMCSSDICCTRGRKFSGSSTWNGKKEEDAIARNSAVATWNTRTPSLESGAIQAMVEALELAEPEMGFSGWFSGTGSMSAEKRKVAANAVSKALALVRGESGKGEGL